MVPATVSCSSGAAVCYQPHQTKFVCYSPAFYWLYPHTNWYGGSYLKVAWLIFRPCPDQAFIVGGPSGRSQTRPMARCNVWCIVQHLAGCGASRRPVNRWHGMPLTVPVSLLRANDSTELLMSLWFILYSSEGESGPRSQSDSYLWGDRLSAVLTLGKRSL